MSVRCLCGARGVLHYIPYVAFDFVLPNALGPVSRQFHPKTARTRRGTKKVSFLKLFGNKLDLFLGP